MSTHWKMSLNLLGKQTERGIPGTRKRMCKGLVAWKDFGRRTNTETTHSEAAMSFPSAFFRTCFCAFPGDSDATNPSPYLPCLLTWHTLLVSLLSPWNLRLSLLQGRRSPRRLLLLCSTCNRQHSRGLLHFTHIAWVISATSLASVIISIQGTPLHVSDSEPFSCCQTSLSIY